MKRLRVFTVLVLLASASIHASTSTPLETCQKMALSLIDNFNASKAESKEQIFEFADVCMPESALSHKSQSSNKNQRFRDIKDITKAQVRM